MTAAIAPTTAEAAIKNSSGLSLAIFTKPSQASRNGGQSPRALMNIGSYLIGRSSQCFAFQRWKKVDGRSDIGWLLNVIAHSRNSLAEPKAEQA
jgi:hypothetical protein